ncbi:multiple epidermal growth factor-like domains protein 10 [Saccostrea cucullata]|uniref:multiple epidermal growth factor-like domains protein 10 n=1 Tax=Saccostrea cuccullata TaxID=36930 RepID=UPI002ED2C760
MKIVKTFLFITFSPFFFPLISVATEPGLGICKGKENICCDGYYEENGTCKVCPGGSYGKNCTQTCPENLYGEFCRGKCKCTTEETCNPVKGCM